jgi:hypothetical protein
MEETMAKPEASIKEIAETANSMAQNALGHALVASVVVDVMITALVETGAIGRMELNVAFQKGLAFIVNQLPGLPSDEMKDIVLSTYRDVATGHGAELKPIK